GGLVRTGAAAAGAACPCPCPCPARRCCAAATKPTDAPSVRASSRRVILIARVCYCTAREPLRRLRELAGPTYRGTFGPGRRGGLRSAFRTSRRGRPSGRPVIDRAAARSVLVPRVPRESSL